MKLTVGEYLTWLALRGLSLFFSCLPRCATICIGKMLGYIVYYLAPIRKKVAIKNICIAFPDKSDDERQVILRNSYRHYGIVLIDFLRIPYLNKNRLSRYLELEPDTFSLLQKLQSGIINTAHIGNWELFIPAVGLQHFPLTIIALKQKNRGANRFFTDARKLGSTQIIFKEEPTQKMIEALDKGFLGLASDQRSKHSGTDVLFFNRITKAPAGAAVFHLKSGKPILFTLVILQDNYKYRVTFDTIPTDVLPDDRSDAVKMINTRYHQMLETAVRAHPEQYFWFHRKWK